MYSRGMIEGYCYGPGRIIHERRTDRPCLELVVITSERDTPKGPRPKTRVVVRSWQQRDMDRVAIMARGARIRASGTLDARAWCDDVRRVWASAEITIDGADAVLEVLP